MKLHLPKLLLTAVMATCVATSAWAANSTTSSITIAGTTYGTETGDVELYIDTDPVTGDAAADYIAVVNKNRWEINEKSEVPTNAVLIAAAGTSADGTTYTGGELYFSRWVNGAYANSDLLISNKIILGSSSYTDGAMRLNDAKNNKIILAGEIEVVENTKILVAEALNYIEGFVSAEGKTITLNAGSRAGLNFSGGATIGTLSAGALTLNFSSKKSDGETAAASTNYTIGSLTGSATIAIDSGVNVAVGSAVATSITNNGTLTIGSTINSGTLVNKGSLVVEDWSGFDFEASGGEDATENGLVDMTKTYQILSGSATLSADSTSTSFTYGGQSHNIANGYTVMEGKVFVIAKDSVTIGGDSPTEGTDLADRYLHKGGTLNLAAGSLSTELVTYTGGSVNLAEGTSYTGLDSVADATLISSITGSGTLYIAETYTTGSSYNGTITTSEGFSGKVYVTSGDFTLNGTTHGETIQLANGVNMQITSNFEFEKSMILDSGDHQIHTNGNTLTISGNISGEGTLDKRASGSITIADGATIANYKHSAGTTNVTGGAVTNLATAGETVNISGGSVTTLSTTGGTINVTGGSITTVKMKGSGNQNLNFKLAEGATSASYTLGSLSTIDTNSYGCNITIDSGVTVEANSVTPGWGFGTITVNGSLNLTEMLELATGDNNDTTRNVITGSGIIDTKKLSIGNLGTYNISGVTMKIGEGGIKKNGNYDAGYTKTNLGAMTIEAKADWDSDVNTLKLVATGSDSTVINTAGYNVALKAGLGGTGNLTKTGEGTLKIGENSTTFTSGAVTVSGGKLELNNATAGTSYTISSLTLDGGALDVTGTLTLSNVTVDLSKYTAGTEVELVKAGAYGENSNFDWTLANADAVGNYAASLDRRESSVWLTWQDTTPSVSSITTSVSTAEGWYTLSPDGMTLTLTVDGSLAGLAADGSVMVNLISEDMMLAIMGDANYKNPYVLLELTDSNKNTVAADALNRVVFVKGDTGQNYWGEMVDFGGEVGTKLAYNVERIPEPTTATLSLLALRGLAARRRRQK